MDYCDNLFIFQDRQLISMATFDAAVYEGVDLLDVGGVEDTNPQIPRNRPPSPLNTGRICYLVPHSISGDRKRLSEAIERVYIVDEADQRGTTALIHAAENGHVDCVKLLITVGADVNIVNNDGYSSLLAASCCCQIHKVFWSVESELSKSLECSRLLLKAGVFVNLTNNVGHNALAKHIGIGNWVNKDLIKLLIAAGETYDKKKFKNFGYERNQLQQPQRIAVDSFLEEFKGAVNLKYLCREAIRDHLIRIAPLLNLFWRAPPLGLPSLLTSYIVYNISLDDSCVIYERIQNTHL